MLARCQFSPPKSLLFGGFGWRWWRDFGVWLQNIPDADTKQKQPGMTRQAKPLADVVMVVVHRFGADKQLLRSLATR